MLLSILMTGCFTATAPPAGDAEALAARLDELETQLGDATGRIAALEAKIGAMEATIGDTQGNPSLATQLADATDALENLGSMIEVTDDGDLLIGHADYRGTLPLERSTDHDVIIAGANLFVVNGADSTATVNQRGNVILGYGEVGLDPAHSLEGWDEAADGLAEGRSGSHNLVIGPRHGYTAWGSVLVGSDNRADAVGAVVIGRRNLAKQYEDLDELHGAYGNLVTGADNRADGAPSGAVVGGNSNYVTGQNDAILGGSTNQPSADGNNRTYVGAHNAVEQGESFATVVGGGDSILYCDDSSYP